MYLTHRKTTIDIGDMFYCHPYNSVKYTVRRVRKCSEAVLPICCLRPKCDGIQVKIMDGKAWHCVSTTWVIEHGHKAVINKIGEV